MQENRRSKLTRRVFRESLTELMLEKGMQKVSVNEICKRADMNRSTFYAHYEDQFDLLREIEDEFLITLRKTVAESNLQNFATKFQSYLSYLRDNSELFILLMKEDGNFRKAITSSAFELYSMRIETGIIEKNDENFESKLYFMAGGSIQVLLNWLASENPASEEDMAKMLYAFWDAIQTVK